MKSEIGTYVLYGQVKGFPGDLGHEAVDEGGGDFVEAEAVAVLADVREGARLHAVPVALVLAVVALEHPLLGVLLLETIHITSTSCKFKHSSNLGY